MFFLITTSTKLVIRLQVLRLVLNMIEYGFADGSRAHYRFADGSRDGHVTDGWDGYEATS